MGVEEYYGKKMRVTFIGEGLAPTALVQRHIF